jgi:hypothetical protein
MTEKKKTISTRWKEWAQKEPFWAYTCLASFLLAMIGLTIHLGVLSGFWRTFGLIMLIGFDAVGLLGITAFRKQWWWFSFFVYITVGVIGWEVASYFFGS